MGNPGLMGGGEGRRAAGGEGGKKDRGLHVCQYGGVGNFDQRGKRHGGKNSAAATAGALSSSGKKTIRIGGKGEKRKESEVDERAVDVSHF